MQDTITLIYGYVFGAWRYRWAALICAWVLSIAGLIFVYTLEDAYVASARIYVDNNTVLAPLLKGLAIQPNIDQRLSLMSRTLLSRPNLEKLMRMADLDLIVRTETEQEEYLTELRQRINLTGDSDNKSLYSIRYQDPERDNAKRIVQALITVFIESSLGDKREDSSDAQEFLNEQIAEYEVRLMEAERRLADFKQRNVGQLPGQSGGFYERLEAAKLALQGAQLQLREMQNRRNELQRQLDGEEPVMLSTTVGSTRAVSPLDSRVQSLQMSLDSLLSRYTEKHPEVRQIRALIEALEAERAEEIEQAMSGEPGNYSGLNSSPVYEGMRAMLAETEATVASLETRVEEYQQRVVELEDKVNNIPVIETELKQLDRDYGVIQSKHSDLLVRRESAMISQSVEKQSNDVTFRVIDPPFVPSAPSEPNKLLLSAAVLFGSIGAGLGLALLLSLIRPVISEPTSLTQLTGRPFLGSVTAVTTAAERRQDMIALAAYAGCTGLLLVVFGALAALHQGVIPGI